MSSGILLHEVTDLFLGLRPDASTSAELSDEVTIAQGFVTEPGRREVVRSEESLDVGKQRSHV